MIAVVNLQWNSCTQFGWYGKGSSRPDETLLWSLPTNSETLVGFYNHVRKVTTIQHWQNGRNVYETETNSKVIDCQKDGLSVKMLCDGMINILF